MTPQQLITAYRQGTSHLDDVAEYYGFMPVVLLGTTTDANMEYRTEVVAALLHDFSIKDIGLIRSLTIEEMVCDSAIGEHENLYQLCFYLFELRQLEDAFILYDAKFNTRNMDTGMTLDREMITLGHEPEEVINFVETIFASNPALKQQYAGLIDQLHGLINYPDYESIKDYGGFLKGYFFGHEQ